MLGKNWIPLKTVEEFFNYKTNSGVKFNVTIGFLVIIKNWIKCLKSLMILLHLDRN